MSVHTGCVKWFNTKAGYGFITFKDESGKETDVFVHHSGIQSTMRKYLVIGEYVEFKLNTVESDKHKFQASNVTGIHGGKLMCETKQLQYNTNRH